jgi:hypothetical protein
VGEPIPEDCFAPPVPNDGALAYEAFWRLCGGRPVTLRSKLNCDGLAPVALIYPWPLAIPWTAISVYAERYGIVEIDEFELFADLVRACDEAYLGAVRER